MQGRQWVGKLKDGDPDAYELLFRTWYPEAFRTAVLITRDQTLAEDAVQEAFIRILQRIGQLRDSARLTTWLHTLVSRTAIDVLRKTAAGRLVAVEDIDLANQTAPDDPWTPPGPPTPEEAALANLRAEAVLAALEELPAEQRRVVVLFYYRQLSIAEIAEATGHPEGTVKSRLNRARARLAETLAAEGDASHA